MNKQLPAQSSYQSIIAPDPGFWLSYHKNLRNHEFLDMGRQIPDHNLYSGKSVNLESHISSYGFPPHKLDK